MNIKHAEQIGASTVESRKLIRGSPRRIELAIEDAMYLGKDNISIELFPENLPMLRKLGYHILDNIDPIVVLDRADRDLPIFYTVSWKEFVVY